MQTRSIKSAGVFPRKFLVCTAAAGLLFGITALADSPYLHNAVLADNKDGDSPQQIFNADTATIYLRTDVVDLPPDTELRASWIAEKSDAANANFEISSSKQTVKADTKFATFSLARPASGWPIGSYHVDLSIDDKLSEQLRFKILKQT